MKLSVIIPVYNGEKTLMPLMESLKNQSLESDRFEVLFIDNGSVDKTKQIIENSIKVNNGLNFIYKFFNDKKSSYSARNIGIKASNHQVLVFTDADCVPEKSWLSNIYEYYLRNPQDIIISGKVDLQISDQKNMWEVFDKNSNMQNENKIKNQSAATANLSVPKRAFHDVGFFLDVTSGGDIEWTQRASKTGYTLVYNSEVIVNHPCRKSYNEIKIKLERHAFGYGEKVIKENKSVLIGTLKQFFRIFYIVTNFRISRQLYGNIGFQNLVLFNIYFQIIRGYQFISFIKGVKSAKQN